MGDLVYSDAHTLTIGGGMTAEARALDFITKHYSNTKLPGTLYTRIVGLLKEQDKATRHACAEKMLELEWEMDNSQASMSEYAHGHCLDTKVV